jgi:hypothetical protein
MASILEDTIIERVRRLPPEKQREVLDFTEFLGERAAPPRKGKSLYGLWADLNVDITEEQISEARKEMWGKFPRDDV